MIDWNFATDYVMYHNFVETVDSSEKKDVEKEAGLDNVQVTSSTGRSSAPTTLSPLQMSDCRFGWRDLSYSVDTKTGKKLILDNVTGCVEKGNKSLSYPFPIPIPSLFHSKSYSPSCSHSFSLHSKYHSNPCFR